MVDNDIFLLACINPNRLVLQANVGKTSAAKSFHVSNDGNQAVTLLQANIAGADADDFWVSNEGLPAQLGANGKSKYL